MDAGWVGGFYDGLRCSGSGGFFLRFSRILGRTPDSWLAMAGCQKRLLVAAVFVNTRSTKLATVLVASSNTAWSRWA